MEKFNHKKAVQALIYFAQKEGGKINNMKAIKLVWLSDRLHLRTYGRTITGDNYFALKNGPIPSSTKDVLKENIFSDSDAINYSKDFICLEGKFDFKIKNEINKKVFSLTDLQTLDTIYKHFGHLDKFQLSDISHEFPEWKKFKSELELYPNRSFGIDKMDFFSNTEDPYDVFKDSEENLNLVKEIFHEYSAF